MTISEPHLLAPAELGTLTGAVTAVYFSSQGLAFAFGIDPRKSALIISLIVTCVTCYASSANTLPDWVCAIANAFVIYLTAAGTSHATAALAATRRQAKPSNRDKESFPIEEVAPDKQSFWTPWF
jgi:hypothetical protein